LEREFANDGVVISSKRRDCDWVCEGASECYHDVKHAWRGMGWVMGGLVWVVDCDGVGLAVR